MKLTLFSRVVVGYLAVFLLILLVSFYAMVQLQRFGVITRSILETDNRVIDYEKKLADTLLEEIRYERKFVVTHDNTFYDQFLLFKSDFERYLDEANAIANQRLAPLLANIKDLHRKYQEIFNNETQEIRARRNYPEAQYRQEKTDAQDHILAGLEKVRSYGQQTTYDKIKKLGDIGDRARRLTMSVMATSLVFIVAVSILTTRSITRPLSLLKTKTREIARGNFEGDIKLSSPPEMAELAGAFNFMCEKLKYLDKMKSEFYSSMSHELRTPLTSIREGTNLLLEGVGGPITEKQKKLLTILAEESARLIGLVNSLLDLSKMEAGMMAYTFELGSLAPLIQRATLEMGPLVEAKRIRLQANVSEELPVLRVDRERILQALRNLIGNAIKFTPEGGEVAISARPIDGQVQVSVMDTGPGIPVESLATIFDKYQQAAPAGANRIQGSGLGLAIVKHIVTSHGGKIWAESKLGRGSTFTFFLPA